MDHFSQFVTEMDALGTQNLSGGSGMACVLVRCDAADAELTEATKASEIKNDFFSSPSQTKGSFTESERGRCRVVEFVLF